MDRGFLLNDLTSFGASRLVTGWQELADLIDWYYKEAHGVKRLDWSAVGRLNPDAPDTIAAAQSQISEQAGLWWNQKLVAIELVDKNTVTVGWQHPAVSLPHITLKYPFSFGTLVMACNSVLDAQRMTAAIKVGFQQALGLPNHFSRSINTPLVLMDALVAGLSRQPVYQNVEVAINSGPADAWAETPLAQVDWQDVSTAFVEVTQDDRFQATEAGLLLCDANDGRCHLVIDIPDHYRDLAAWLWLMAVDKTRSPLLDKREMAA